MTKSIHDNNSSLQYREVTSQENIQFVNLLNQEIKKEKQDYQNEKSSLHSYIEKLTESTLNITKQVEFDTFLQKEQKQTLFEYALKELKHTSVKLKQNFAIDYHTRKYSKLSRTQFSFLNAITPFIDIDFSICIDLETFRLNYHQKQNQMERTINQLLKAGLLVKDNDRFYVTERTHTLVKPNYHNEEQKELYIPTISQFQDYEIVKQLSTAQHRFYYYLLANVVVKGDTMYHSVRVNRLYDNSKASQANYLRSNMRDFKEVIQALAKFLTVGLVHFELVNKQVGFHLSYLNNKERNYAAEGSHKIYEEIIETISKASYVKNNFVGPFFEGLTLKVYVQNQAKNQVNNLAGFIELENKLIELMPIKQRDIYKMELVEHFFVNSEGEFDIEQNEANLFINAKKELAYVLGNTRAAKYLIEPLIKQYFKEQALNIRPYSVNKKCFSIFKDFHFMRTIEDHIYTQLKLELLLQKNETYINTDYITFNHIPEVISLESFNMLIWYFSKNANRNTLILFMKRFEDLVTTFAEQQQTEVDYLIREVLLKKYPALEYVYTTYYEKVNLLYKSFMSNDLNLDVEVTFNVFCETLPTIIRTVGLTDDELVAKFIVLAQKEYNKHLKSEEVRKKVVSVEQEQIKKVQMYPTSLLKAAATRGVYSYFFKDASDLIAKYHQTVINTVEFRESDNDKVVIALASVETISKAKEELYQELMLLEEYYADTPANAAKFKHDFDNILVRFNKPNYSHAAFKYHDFMNQYNSN